MAETPKAVSPLDAIIDAVAAAVISRLDLASLVKAQLQDVTVFGQWVRSSANNVFDEKIDEAAGDYSSVMGEAMRKIAEEIFNEKIDDALENYDCSEAIEKAIEKALDDKDFESDMDDKIEKAFEEVDWAEELRNLRFRAV